VDPTVPRPLARVVGRCLEADAGRRPSAGELEGELDRYLRRRARRARVLLGGAGLVAAGLLAMLLAGGPPPSPVPPGPPDTGVRPPPATAAEFFDRGVEFLKVKNIASAMADFDAALEKRPDDGRGKAFLAYCFARRQKDHPTAAKLYEEAVAGGYRAPWVHNNRAYSLLQMGSPPSHALLRLAIEEATAALELSPNLRPALYNRAWARYLLNLDPDTHTLSDPDCLNDLEAVMMTAGPCTADLYYKAALILAASGSDREDLRARAVGCLREAVARGKPPRPLPKNPVVRAHLLGRPDFDELVRNPPPARSTPPANVELVDPPTR
jgi:tetratricopeptide (TPR) repeat protein